MSNFVKYPSFLFEAGVWVGSDCWRDVTHSFTPRFMAVNFSNWVKCEQLVCYCFLFPSGECPLPSGTMITASLHSLQQQKRSRWSYWGCVDYCIDLVRLTQDFYLGFALLVFCSSHESSLSTLNSLILLSLSNFITMPIILGAEAPVTRFFCQFWALIKIILNLINNWGDLSHFVLDEIFCSD